MQSNPTKAVFYILENSTPKLRVAVACRLTEKAYQSGRRVFLLGTTQKDADDIDSTLWTFRDISFIPHQIFVPDLEEIPQVLIGVDATTAPPNFEVLINLTNAVPACHNKFPHIIEIIPSDDEARALGRKRYQFYQAQGYKMETHTIDGSK